MKIVLAIILTMVLLISIPSVVYADDSVNVDIDIWGSNPDTWLTLWGDNPDVWINGKHISTFATKEALFYLDQSMRNIVRSGVPNGRYSGASSPGWQGYFGVLSNDTIVVIDHVNPGKIAYSVYQGSGCGGSWGISDGYPDFWSRRQLLGLLPILESHNRNILSTTEGVEEIQSTLEELNRKDYDVRIAVNSADLATFTYSTDQLSKKVAGQVATIEVLQHDNSQLETLVYVLVGSLLLLIAWVGFLATRIRRS